MNDMQDIIKQLSQAKEHWLKPRIKRCVIGWECTGCGISAISTTPALAYAEWKRRATPPQQYWQQPRPLRPQDDYWTRRYGKDVPYTAPYFLTCAASPQVQ